MLNRLDFFIIIFILQNIALLVIYSRGVYMFGLGMTELILIAIVALIVIGPKKLPEVAKSIGKGYGEFKRSFSEFKGSVDLESDIKNSTKTNENSSTNKPSTADYSAKYKDDWNKKITNALTDKKSTDDTDKS